MTVKTEAAVFADEAVPGVPPQRAAGGVCTGDAVDSEAAVPEEHAVPGVLTTIFVGESVAKAKYIFELMVRTKMMKEKRGKVHNTPAEATCETIVEP